MKLTKDYFIEGQVIPKGTEIEVLNNDKNIKEDRIIEDNQDIMIACNKLIDLVYESLDVLHNSDTDLGYKLGQSLGEAFYKGQKGDLNDFIKGIIRGVS